MTYFLPWRSSMLGALLLLLAFHLVYARMDLQAPAGEVLRWSANDIATTTIYLLSTSAAGNTGAVTADSFASNATYMMNAPRTLRNLRCVHAAVAGGTTWTFTVRIQQIATAITCVSAATTTGCNDLTNTAAASIGQQVSVELVDSAATDGSAVFCTLEAH